MSDAEMEGHASDGEAAQGARSKKPTLQQIQLIHSALLASDKKIGKAAVAEQLSQISDCALKAKVKT